MTSSTNTSNQQEQAASDRSKEEMNVTKNSTTQTMEKIYYNVHSDKYSFDNIFKYIEGTNNNNIGKLHSIAIGHILHKLKIKNIIGIKSIGKNRIFLFLLSFYWKKGSYKRY